MGKLFRYVDMTLTRSHKEANACTSSLAAYSAVTPASPSCRTLINNWNTERARKTMRGIVWENFECRRPQAEELAHALVLRSLLYAKEKDLQGVPDAFLNFVLAVLGHLCASGAHRVGRGLERGNLFGRTRALERRPKDIHRRLQRVQSTLEIRCLQLLNDVLADDG